ncbi:MAG: asparagine synthetase A [Candidatus Thermoplasmatota archaeon]|nr:asparagine synthetase A [Candidatus Thermoplasmatota archaeon]
MCEQILQEILVKKVADECYRRFASDRIVPIIDIKSRIREITANFLRNEGFVEISPVIISPITDPLNHGILDGKITYYGHAYAITKSMILHKQLALLAFEKIFSFSPNIRLETGEKKETRRHLVEFTQLDLEVRHASRDDMIELAEKLLIHVIKDTKKSCKEELKELERKLKIPSRPFKRITFDQAYKRYGNEFEIVLSNELMEPFWITDFPIWNREFYDREFEDKPGLLRDMDMVYPEGCGEGLSGGEREYEYNKIRERMKISGLNISAFLPYLEIAKKGIHPSAGFGIGLERLTRFICGLKDIRHATLFPKIPGEYCI